MHIGRQVCGICKEKKWDISSATMEGIESLSSGSAVFILFFCLLVFLCFCVLSWEEGVRINVQYNKVLQELHWILFIMRILRHCRVGTSCRAIEIGTSSTVHCITWIDPAWHAQCSSMQPKNVYSIYLYSTLGFVPGCYCTLNLSLPKLLFFSYRTVSTRDRAIDRGRGEGEKRESSPQGPLRMLTIHTIQISLTANGRFVSFRFIWSSSSQVKYIYWQPSF